MRSPAAFGAGKNPEAAGDPAVSPEVSGKFFDGRPALFSPADVRAALAALGPRAARPDAPTDCVTFDPPADPAEGALFDAPDLSPDGSGLACASARIHPIHDTRTHLAAQADEGSRAAALRTPTSTAAEGHRAAGSRAPATRGSLAVDGAENCVTLDSSVRLAWSGRAAPPSSLGSPREPRLLPVREDLTPLFPWGGLRRGGTVAVRDSTALLLTLLAEPTANGSWAAIVGIPDLGVLAAAELGVAVDRLALVPKPGNDLVNVTAALLDGFDVVAVATPGITAAQARRLSARARNRGAALLAFGAWPGADLELSCAGARWSGLGDGHGHLQSRLVDVHAQGRGSATRPARILFTLQGVAPPPSPRPTLAARLPA